ncbi:MAG TPA: DUF58 domain-containing protein [Kofleriaceae bacterium]|nr:DUF58 domain-containing protein [Kofleriaceae bacterium]
MIPLPAKRGRYVLASAALFLVVGAIYGSAPLVALGGVSLSALMTAYLAFFPTAILLRRRKIELSWWVPPGDQPGGALSVDRPFQVHVALRNHGGRILRVLEIDLFGTAALDLPRGLEASVPAGMQVEVAGETRARAAGYQVLHGAVLVFGDALGLFEVRAYFPNPIAIKVFPRQAQLRGPAALRNAGGAVHERIGIHQMRRRGLAGELREIREHSHGDPFKMIAWKATARRGRLMVRDLETEIVVTHQFLLDIAGTMRNASAGRSKLDYAVEMASALSRAALDGGDRVGLVTFDSRVYSELKPGDGHHHYLKLVDRLLETHNVVDEDLTDLTNGELVSAVARYLAHQEAVDVRLRRAPTLDDPAWERIQAGPGGELYDVGALAKVVQALLKSMGQTSGGRQLAPAWWWTRVPIAPESDPQMARLRLFCRLRGIELPYRPQHPHGRRAAGLGEAARKLASSGRADVVILLSDLVGVLESPDSAAAAMAQLRRAGRQVIAIAPFGPAFLATPETAAGARVASVLAREEAEVLEAGTRLLLRWGVPVVRAGPEDTPAALLSRIARQGGGMRRVA